VAYRHVLRPASGCGCPPAALAEPLWTELLPGETPADLRCQHDAAEEWALVSPKLQAAGVVTAVDVSLVVNYCVSHARLQMCEREISRMGMVARSERGLVRNPVCTIASQYRTALARYRRELGLGRGRGRT
jgi:P27 family predicted phage terminase small subunit